MKWIPFIMQGKLNSELDPGDSARALQALELLARETADFTHKLNRNYDVKHMHYDEMFTYGVMWDNDKDEPVCCSGLQTFGIAGRMLSRYYVFKSHRPTLNAFTNDIDDYQMMQIQQCAPYPFLFISRDTGTKYFERLKKYRPDVYGDFEIYPDKIELKYKDNWQSIFYYNKGRLSSDQISDVISQLSFKHPTR